MHICHHHYHGRLVANVGRYFVVLTIVACNRGGDGVMTMKDECNKRGSRLIDSPDKKKQNPGGFGYGSVG